MCIRDSYSVQWQDGNPSTAGSKYAGRNNLCYQFSDISKPTILNRAWCKGTCDDASPGGWTSFATDRNGVKYFTNTGLNEGSTNIPTSASLGTSSKCYSPYH
eukprot:TRINITY_DN158_c0_g2_i7.p2 TRINITY_DN158_c0_g2~~TRINITY_DN158_c0_g2_i7.p2  ORF type:complete len:102 (-),score=21.44 TRINITY_DN158_c0_g2_i7:291-596(-)